MCKSVPQIEAVFTRTSTSAGPIAGTATVSICRPFEARIFRNAFMVVAILLSCLCRARLLRRAALGAAGASTQFPMLAHGAIDSRKPACACSFLSFSLPPFIHPHHLPRRRILLVQLRRFHNQPLHSRPLHIRQTPQPYVTHALRLALQQFLRIGKHRSPQKCQRYMLFPQHIDAERSVRIKRRSLPRTYVFLAVCGRFLHQRPHCLHYSRKSARLPHVRINPQPPLFPLNGWHLALLKSTALQPLILVLVPSSCVLPLFHLFHQPNLLQRLQILHHHLQWHRPILRRHRIPNP